MFPGLVNQSRIKTYLLMRNFTGIDIFKNYVKAMVKCIRILITEFADQKMKRNCFKI